MSRVSIAELVEQINHAPKPKDINQNTWNIELTNLDTKAVEVFTLTADKKRKVWNVKLS